MAGQQICLKWNSFQTNIVTSFENLWEEEGLVDVTLASDGQCIRAHKVILSACSPFFRRVFQSNPCQHPVIILQDVHFTELESLLCFVYKGEVNIGQESLPALLKAAETLQIRGLSGASEQVKEKMAVPRKTQPSESPSEPSLHPPTKRHRGCSSPPLPSTPTHVEHPPTSSSPPCTPPLALTAKTEGREEEVQVPTCGDIEAGVAEEILRETEGETSCTPHGVGTDSMCGGDDEDEDYGDEDQPLAHLSLKMEPPEFDCGGDSNSLPLALTLTLPTSSEELNIPTLLSKSRRSSDCRLDATQIKGEGGNNSLQHRRSRNRGLGGCGMGARRKRRHYNNFIWRGPAAATSLLGITEGRVAIQGSGGQEEQQAGKEAESAVREGEEAEGESAQGPAVAAPPSLLIEKSEGVLNEGDINEESGPLPPYSLLPHACLLPSPSILSAWAKARTPEQLSCDLMRLLFSTEERLVCNVNGKMGKRRFDAHKVLLIREVVRHHYNECSGAGIMSGREGTREHCEVIEKIPAQVEVTPVTQCLSYPATPFPCPFCERAYTSWGFRRRHIKAVHAFAHPLQLSCKWCPKPPGGSMMVNNGPAHMSVSKWERHVVDKHGITMAEVHSSLEILEEAHMVLQIAEPLRLASISAGVRVNNCEKESKISFECDVGQSCGSRTPISDTSRRRTHQGFEDEETSNNKRYRVANNGLNQDWPGNSGFDMRYQ